MNFPTEEYRSRTKQKKWAFRQIADELGKEHPITKMMGSRAWGRSSFEEGGTRNKQTAIREWAALDGAFDVINTWARDNDKAAQRIMLDIWHKKD